MIASAGLHVWHSPVRREVASNRSSIPSEVTVLTTELSQERPTSRSGQLGKTWKEGNDEPASC